MKTPILTLCALLLVGVLAIRFAQPIQDGDLFWHMAYAKQMIARQTLILDHTAFSWTPSSNQMIYCAWASELFLYWLWNHFGLAGMFALRYLFVVALLGLAWNYAQRLGVARQPVTWLILMLLLLSSVAGTIIKPEMFSLLFFNVLVWLFFQFRLDAQPRWLYLVPVLLLVWVNTHGGFILAAPFLAATLVGETLHRRVTRHQVIAWALCGVAVLATPYGWRYPWQLFEDYVLGKTARPDVAWNDAHLSIFADAAASLHFVDLLVLMAAILALLWLRSRRADWSILLALAAYLPLYMIYLRTTFFLPAVFCYGGLFLAQLFYLSPKTALIPERRLLTAVALPLFLFLGVRASIEAWTNPSYGTWLGFGIGYSNPVAEAEFLASSNLGPRMYNLFDGGGYLLWRLDPQYKVMTDSRSFPYLEWFDDQYKFSMGEGVEEFVRRYPADVAVIELLHEPTWRSFLKSPDWRPVFCGPSAVIFARKTAAYQSEFRFETGLLKNADHAIRVFHFALAMGDYSAAWAILNRLETALKHQAITSELEAALAYREGHRALRAGDWSRAQTQFDLAVTEVDEDERLRLIRIFLGNIRTLRAQGNVEQTRTFEAALAKLAAPEK